MANKKRKRKSSATRRRSRKASRFHWRQLAIGLIVGVGLVLLVQFVIQRTLSREGGLRHALESRQNTAPKAATRKPVQNKAQSPKPPKFDFYTILLESESVITDAELQQSRRSQADRDIRYMLQAGAFANHQDADRLKAQLALHGLQAQIQKIRIEGKGEFHRVRLGPYRDLQRLEEVNQRLHSLGIKSLRLKLAG